MINPFTFVNREEELHMLNINNVTVTRGNLITVSIADIHFGALDPKYQYELLKEQFINKIEHIYFDILAIAGDLFDHKYMSNSDVVMYACLFISDLINICRNKNRTIILLEGTKEHDAGQLKLFYHYLEDPEIDIRIVEKTKFEYVKGAKILCIPEEYDKGENYYNKFLKHSGMYDMVIMHGMFEGALYTGKKEDLNSSRAPEFKMEDFGNCLGVMISGHVHTPGCFKGYFYYCGSPMRWEHGQEQAKGFLVTLYNLDTRYHYTHFEEITSFKYVTINVDDIISRNPEYVIDYITRVQKEQNIDHIRVQIVTPPSEGCVPNIELISKYYRNNNTVKIDNKFDKKHKFIKETNDFLEENKKYEFILDNNLSPEEIFVKYVNIQKGYTYITVEELKNILNDGF